MRGCADRQRKQQQQQQLLLGSSSHTGGRRRERQEVQDIDLPELHIQTGHNTHKSLGEMVQPQSCSSHRVSEAAHL